MILLDSILKTAIEPAFDLLPAKLASDEARVMLLAIGLQESRFMYRFQKVAGKPYIKGPAKSFWQFEEGGGVKGVMQHHATKDPAQKLCAIRGVPFESKALHHAMEDDDVLAAGMARLLLFADPRKLPAANVTHDEAWDCYVRNWRPGKPHRHTWDEFHRAAQAQVMEGMA